VENKEFVNNYDSNNNLERSKESIYDPIFPEGKFVHITKIENDVFGISRFILDAIKERKSVPFTELKELTRKHFYDNYEGIFFCSIYFFADVFKRAYSTLLNFHVIREEERTLGDNKYTFVSLAKNNFFVELKYGLSFLAFMLRTFFGRRPSR